MSAAILLMGMALLTSGATSDTTVALHRGDRVEVRGFSGEVRVQAWSRADLEVSDREDEERGISVRRSGDRIRVEPDDRKGRRMDVTMTLRVPSWAVLDVQGRELDVHVSGTSAPVSVRNVKGDIQAHGTTGDLDLSSVEGEITVTDAHGRVSAQSRGDDVRLSDIVGDVEASTGNGDIRLERIRSASVHAETLDGDVYFAGSFVPEGHYAFSVHDGDATLVVPRTSSAHVTVATFDGEFSSDFPVTLRHYTGNGRFDFTIGRGGAEVSVEVFDGEIRIRNAQGASSGHGRDHGSTKTDSRAWPQGH